MDLVQFNTEHFEFGQGFLPVGWSTIYGPIIVNNAWQYCVIIIVMIFCVILF